MILDWCASVWTKLCAVDGREVVLSIHRRHEPYPMRLPDLTAEVRFHALVRIENGRGRRPSRRNTKKREGFTMSRVRIYATTLGGLIRCAHAGVDLHLVPSAKVHKHGRAVLSAAELGRLAVALDVAIERGEFMMKADSAAPMLAIQESLL